MTGRHSVRTRVLRLRRQSRQTGQVRLSAGALRTAGGLAVHGLLAFGLAFAVVLEDRSPFAAALVAGAGGGLMGLFSLLGAGLGYLAALEVNEALRYIAASLLIYAAAFAFCDLSFAKKTVFPCFSAALFMGFTGFLVDAPLGFRQSDVVALLCEAGLTAGAVWCFRNALTPPEQAKTLSPARRISILTLACLLLTTVVPVSLGDDVSLGRTLAAAAVFSAAWQSGPAMGAAAGVAMGLACDLSGVGGPLYGTLCGLLGLFAGVGQGRGRLVSLECGWAGAGFLLFFLWGDHFTTAPVYEVLLGGVVFLSIPRKLLRQLGVWLRPVPAGLVSQRARELTRQKLHAAATAFLSLGQSLQSALRDRENENDVAAVFDRAANRVCRTCAFRDRCWKQDYALTFNALNQVVPAMTDRGRAEEGDFPKNFSDRCVHFPGFVVAVNEELTALFCRRQYNARIRESRAAVCRQYAQLAELLDSAALELGDELSPDVLNDRRVRQRVAELDLNVNTSVYRDGRGLLHLEARGPGSPELSAPLRVEDLSLLLDAPMRVAREDRERLSLIQQEPLQAETGTAARRKEGETVSGDTAACFRREDGVLFLLLCDGMGCGPEANTESALAVKLLEEFLQAGVETAHALTTLAAALALRSEDTGGFTTVDLLEVDLFQGDCRLFKLGAAPTYVRTRSGVQRYAGFSLPAGLAQGEQAAPDRFTFRLFPGDCVLMVSDGVFAPGEDDWLMDRLAEFEGAPGVFAKLLLSDCPGAPNDDRTAMVVRLENRE